MQQPKNILAVLAALLLLAAGCGKAYAEPPARRTFGPRTPAQVERSLDMVGRLIETSSIAKQIRESGKEEAAAKLGKAEDLHKQARAAFEAGDTEQASKLLSQSRILVMSAAHLSRSEGDIKGKLKRDFDTRMTAVNALMEARQRIVQEKDLGEAQKALDEEVNTLVSQAKGLAGEGKYEEGFKVLQKASQLVKASVERLRNGETLVRSLHFETEEDEYHYELDRNNTHQMLAKTLIEKRAPQKMTPRVRQYLDKALELRAQAEKQGADGDFATAIKTLEESTRNIIYALRNAGFFIPG